MKAIFAGEFVALLGAAILFFSTTLATPINPPKIWPCKNPLVRKEWRTLSSTEKSNYIKAVQCLAKYPTLTANLNATVHAFESFQAVHNQQTPDIHFVGHFLAWHRYFVWAYEKALRTKCGYTGAQPYWDWVQDAESGLPMEEFPVFSSVDGFGGNGPFVPLQPGEFDFGLTDRTGGGCVPDGPFTQAKGFTLNVVGQDLQTKQPHCLRRDFAPATFAHMVRQSVVDEMMAQPNFEQFAWRTEGIPSFALPNVHGGGHFATGGVKGQMGDSSNSPGDPVFYLHHANLDRIYWEWQEKNPLRYFDVGGPIKPFDYSNQQAGNVTLTFSINLSPIAPAIPLAATLYTRGPLFCYVYE